jgi:phenylalanyl-tRNA synthetase beta chain
VLVEAATFDHRLIRHAARMLGLRTEASLRFGRGVDADGVDLASRRVAHWIQRLCGAKVHRGCADAYPQPKPTRTVSLRASAIRGLLGIAVPDTDVPDILSRLGLEIRGIDGHFEAKIPSYRDDLRREADLIEEVGRIYGYDRVLSESPRVPLRVGRKDPREQLKDRVQDLLVGLGMDEVVNDGFAPPEWSSAMGWAPDDGIRIRNPMLDAQSALRPALLPGLLATVEANANHGMDGGMLFEVGRVFPKDQDERDAVAGAAFGRTRIPLRGKASFTAADMKGLLYAMLDGLRIRDLRLDPGRCPPFLEPGRGGALLVEGHELGVFGALAVTLADRLPTPVAVFVFELDLAVVRDVLEAQPPFVPLPRYPASKRDLSLSVPAGVLEGQIRTILAAPPEVERLLLYDEYSGDQLGEGRRSLTYELALRAADRTLTDQDVAAIIGDLERRLGEHDVVLRR